MENERKNIEITNDGGIVCDSCDWKDLTVTQEQLKDWINKPCPICGANALTEEDYQASVMLRASIDYINSLSPEEVEELHKNLMLGNLVDEDLLKQAENVGDGPVQCTVKVDKNGIKISNIRKDEDS